MEGEFGIDGFDIPFEVVFPVGGGVFLAPGVGHVAADEGDAGEEAEVEVVVEAEVADDVDVEAGAVV